MHRVRHDRLVHDGRVYVHHVYIGRLMLAWGNGLGPYQSLRAWWFTVTWERPV